MSEHAEKTRIEKALTSHFVWWQYRQTNAVMSTWASAGPPGDWRCSCGLKFGFSTTAINHVSEMVVAQLTPTGGTQRLEYGVQFCNETQAEDLFDNVIEAEQCVDHIRKMIREDEYDPDDYEPIAIVRRTVTTFEPVVTDWDVVAMSEQTVTEGQS